MSIESELKKWMADPRNQKRIEKAKAEKAKKSKDILNQALQYASELRQYVYDNIPVSLKAGSEHPIELDDIIISKPTVLPNGSLQINLSFASDSIHRDSLDPEIHDGKYKDGVDNIISLFVKGYTAHGDVSGMWHGQMVLNKLHRKASPFMQEAVDEFLVKHGDVAQVTLPEDYKA